MQKGYALAQGLETEGGLPIFAMRMGSLSLSPPCKELERRLARQKIMHGGNPVLRWMADNVAVKEFPNGNIMPDKVHSQGKIDGIVAVIMALDRAMRGAVEADKSIYDEREVRAV